jgi:uncharacterized protein YhdP
VPSSDSRNGLRGAAGGDVVSRRWWRRALQLVGAVFAVAALLAAVFAWRLSRGPIDVGFLTPFLERALSRSAGSFAVRIGTSELAWTAHDHAIELRARDVQLVSGQERIAWVPALSVELSRSALLHGAVVPTSVELHRPELALVREKTGELKVAAATGENLMPGTPLGSGRPGDPLAQLDRIQVREGQLAFLDRAHGEAWHLRGVELALQRSEAGIALELTGGVEMGTTLVPVRVEGLYHPDSATAAATLSFERIEPAALAARAMSPTVVVGLLSRLRLPVSGVVALELDGSLRPLRIRLTAEGGRGSIATAELPAVEVAVERLHVRAMLDVEENALVVEKLVLDLGGSSLGAHGRMKLDGARTVEAGMTLTRARVIDLARYWPEQALPGVRTWIASSLTAGYLRDGRLEVSGAVSDAGGLEIDVVSGSLGFDRVALRLPAGLPSPTGLAGTVSFERGAWNVAVGRGTIAGLDIVHASVGPGLRSAGEARVAVSGAISGPLARALALIDAGRPGFAAGLDFRLDEVTGSGFAEFDTSFVPGRALDTSWLPLVVSARLRDVSVPRAFRGWSVSSGDLGVELQGRALEVKGRAAVEGAPVAIAWRETLGDGGSARRIDVSGRVGADARTALGLDLRPSMDGPVDVRASVELARGAGTVDVFVDLAGSSVDFPPLLLSKSAGAPGRAEAHASVSGGTVTRVEGALLRVEGAEVRGRATLSSAGARIQTIDAQATLGPVPPAQIPAHVALVVRDDAAGHAFVLTSDDAGTLYHAFGPQAYARGGRLRFEGSVPRDTSGFPLEGRLEVRDLTITSAPLLARLATLASLRGVKQSLTDDGIAFREVTADIRHRDTTVTITDGMAKAPELVLLVRGTIDQRARTTDLRGTLVPSYWGLNAIGSRVPVLGRPLAGSGDQGIQAFDFRVGGPLASPQVSVDPVSAVAPGALRDLVRRLSAGIRWPGGGRP